MISAKERAEVEFMEPHSYDGWNTVTWEKVSVIKTRWMCNECGLVWNMQHEAENCAKRGHATSYVKHYGGYYENGVRRGGAQYTLYAVRREKVPRAQECIAP